MAVNKTQCCNWLSTSAFMSNKHSIFENRLLKAQENLNIAKTKTNTWIDTPERGFPGNYNRFLHNRQWDVYVGAFIWTKIMHSLLMHLNYQRKCNLSHTVYVGAEG